MTPFEHRSFKLMLADPPHPLCPAGKNPSILQKDAQSLSGKAMARSAISGVKSLVGKETNFLIAFSLLSHVGFLLTISV